MRQASPATLMAWAYTSLANGVGSAKRGSVLIATLTIPLTSRSKPVRQNARRRRRHESASKRPVNGPVARGRDRGVTRYSCSMSGIDVAVGVGAEPEAIPAVGVRYLNRELSFLDFVARVLALAEDPTVPLLERAKFLAIVSEHLDEFFQVRVAGLHGAARRRAPHHDPRRPRSRRPAPRDPRAGRRALAEREADVFAKELVPALDEHGVGFAQWADLSDDDRAVPRQPVHGEHLPGAHAARGRSRAPVPVHLEPVAEPRGRRCATRRPARSASRGSRCRRCSPASSSSPTRSASCCSSSSSPPSSRRCFPGMEVLAHSPFRVTARHRLRARRRGRGPPRGGRVRPAPAQPLRPRRAARGRHDHERRDAGAAVPGARAVGGRRHHDRRPARSRRALVAVRARPARPQGRGVGAADAARARGRRARPPTSSACSQTSDVLVHHPYDSFTTSVEQFVEQAAGDPRRPRDQADHLPHRRARERDRPRADQGRRAGQGGRRARRAHGTLRRAGEHRTCTRPRRSGRARRVRPRRAEDPRQDPARRAPGGRRHPAVLPHRNRQLQRQDREHLRRPRPAHRRPRPRRRPHRPVQPPHRLQPPGLLPQAARRAVARSPGDAGSHRG